MPFELVMLATCLGCGCACDDIDLQVDGHRIVEARHACPLGVAWFGDGSLPAQLRVGGRQATLEAALDAALALLIDARRPFVYLAADISCETQREAIALADWVRASLSSLTTSAIASLLAAQEQGRAAATLGEIRNRADVIVFWGVDPAIRYPRFWTRYAPEPAGVHVPHGRRSRTLVAVDVGDARGPADADVRMHIHADKEVATLTWLTAAVSGPGVPMAASVTQAVISSIAHTMRAGRYVAIVADAEPADGGNARDAGRASALIALAQALNGPTRGALSTLRAGGNRTGADSCTTSQTGYPTAIDFSRAYPRYRPYDAAVTSGDGADVMLVVGDAAAMPDDLVARTRRARRIIVGPRASDGPLGDADVVIDTGVAGIHESGTALRMDDVPVPLRSPLTGALPAREAIRQLRDRVRLLGRP